MVVQNWNFMTVKYICELFFIYESSRPIGVNLCYLTNLRSYTERIIFIFIFMIQLCGENSFFINA
jgi:hypothetical protein